LALSDVVLEVFATAEAGERHRGLLEAAGDRWVEVDPDVVEAIADAVHPQGVVARCRSVVGTLADLPATAAFVVVCADVRDPGNAGAVIRCADAAGADAVIVAGDSVDPTNPKAVRSTAGSLFHLPVLAHRSVAEVISLLQSSGLQVLAADGSGAVGLHDAELDLSGPTAWLMGNEAWGLPPDLSALADQVVAVPIYGLAESLNLATAAAVCLYASAAARHG
jgi:TrmH family RNA methyltransferase